MKDNQYAYKNAALYTGLIALILLAPLYLYTIYVKNIHEIQNELFLKQQSALLISAMLGQFGIIDLIAKGYGTIAWGFLIVFIIPIMTIGVYKIYLSSRSPGVNT